MEIEKKTYLTSYFKNDTFLKKENDNFEIYVKGDCNYSETIKEKAYNKSGDFIGYVISKNFYDKYFCGKIDADFIQKSIVQIDYDFHLMPVGRLNTIDELNDCDNLLVRSRLKKESPTIYNYECDFLHNTKSEKIGHKTKYKETFRNPVEINVVGYSRNILNPLKLKIIEFNGLKYFNNYKKALKKYPEHKGDINLLYYKNCNFLKLYFNVNDKQIKTEFNIKNKMIEKLHRRISNKPNIINL